MQMNRIGQVVTVQNVGLLLLVAGQMLAKYGTSEFTWSAFSMTLTLTVLGWFGLSAQGRYNASRLALEERRLALETERFDRSDGRYRDL